MQMMTGILNFKSRNVRSEKNIYEETLIYQTLLEDEKSQVLESNCFLL